MRQYVTTGTASATSTTSPFLREASRLCPRSRTARPSAADHVRRVSAPSADGADGWPGHGVARPARVPAGGADAGGRLSGHGQGVLRLRLQGLPGDGDPPGCRAHALADPARGQARHHDGRPLDVLQDPLPVGGGRGAGVGVGAQHVGVDPRQVHCADDAELLIGGDVDGGQVVRVGRGDGHPRVAVAQRQDGGADRGDVPAADVVDHDGPLIR